MKKPIVIFGTAEIAELASFYFKHDSDFEVVAFTVDDDYVVEDSFCGLSVIPFSEIESKYPPQEYDMHIALSYNKLNRLRQDKYFQAKKSGYTLISYISSKSAYWPGITVGENCFILENQTLQPGVMIGNNVMIWSGNHIGHGTRINDHVYLASHICISGHCEIGERTFIGVNAAIRDFCSIGSDCFITMGACVTQQVVESGSVVLGAKGLTLEPHDERSKSIISKYFNL